MDFRVTSIAKGKNARLELFYDCNNLPLLRVHKLIVLSLLYNFLLDNNNNSLTFTVNILYIYISTMSMFLIAMPLINIINYLKMNKFAGILFKTSFIPRFIDYTV